MKILLQARATAKTIEENQECIRIRFRGILTDWSVGKVHEPSVLNKVYFIFYGPLRCVLIRRLQATEGCASSFLQKKCDVPRSLIVHTFISRRE